MLHYEACHLGFHCLSKFSFYKGFTLCMLGNFAYFLLSADFFFFFSKLISSKNSFVKYIRVSNSLDPDPDLWVKIRPQGFMLNFEMFIK